MDLKGRIQAQFPEGLTGIFALGGTRTSYATQCQRDSNNPGAISDFDHYVEYGLSKSLEIIEWFFRCGGSYAILEILDIYRVTNNREGYRNAAIDAGYSLIDETRREYYQDHSIDPFFSGIDTLLYVPENHPAHQLARAYTQFQANWQYSDKHKKIIFEIAPIPLYTFVQTVKPTIDKDDSLLGLAERLYKHYAQAAYGIYVPPPSFYVGQSRNGDMKSLAFLPMSLDTTGRMRMYFTQYPSFYLTYDAVQKILYDLVNTRLRANSYDYRDEMTLEMANEMHERFSKMAEGDIIAGLST